MTTTVKIAPITRAEAVRLLRTPGAYAIGEMAMTYYTWIKRPGQPDVQVSKAVIGYVRDRYGMMADRTTKPWKWMLSGGGEP